MYASDNESDDIEMANLRTKMANNLALNNSDDESENYFQSSYNIEMLSPKRKAKHHIWL